MDKRSIIQAEASDTIVQNKFSGFVDIAPRTGKSKIVIDAIKQAGLKTNEILITAPFNPILQSWIKEFNTWDIEPIDTINQRSLAKVPYGKYKYIICDEVHTLTTKQIEYINMLGIPVLGVTGSVSKKTEVGLKQALGLKRLYTYSLDQAVEDKIISDYEIIIVSCNLDAADKYVLSGSKAKPFYTTELAAYQYYTKEFDRFKVLSWGNPKYEFTKMHYAKKRAELLYTCRTKLEVCKRLLAKQDRALLFTVYTQIADELCEHSYHSKTEEDNTLDRFIDGEIPKLSVCNLVSMGVTIPNLKTGIFHQMQSNEEMAIQKVLRMCNLEGDTKAAIYICMLNNTVDEEWVKKSLSLFNPNKITYIDSRAV